MTNKEKEMLKRIDKKKEDMLTKSRGKCASCGSGFNQQWDNKRKMYSAFALCPDCRKKSTQQNVKELNYELKYSPYPYQLKMHESKARFRLVAGAIRTGKDYSQTAELIMYASKCANEDRDPKLMPKVRAWIVAPTDDIAKEDFQRVSTLIPKELVLTYSASEGKIVTKNGITIEVKSAHNPESLVAVGLDALLITEAARIRNLEDVWSNLEGRLNSGGRGLNGMGGIALINSSPLGKNYFYTMWKWGHKGNPNKSPLWESWTWTHWDNPENNAKNDVLLENGRTYRQDLEMRMSPMRYKQDYLAEFLANDFSVFKDFEKNCLEAIPNVLDGKPLSDKDREEYIEKWRTPDRYKNYTIGYDPANLGDEPIIWIVENDTGKLMEAVTLKGLGWDGQFDAIAMYSKKYNNAIVSFGRTGHETVDSQLIKRGLTTVPLNEQGANKGNLVENLARIVQSKLLRVLDDGSEITETIKFQFADYVRTLSGNKITYANATSSGHDDHVSAAYFAFADIEAEESRPMPFMGAVGIKMGR